MATRAINLHLKCTSTFVFNTSTTALPAGTIIRSIFDKSFAHFKLHIFYTLLVMYEYAVAA